MTKQGRIGNANTVLLDYVYIYATRVIAVYGSRCCYLPGSGFRQGGLLI